jgi:glycerol-3-phosphate cytidylyltransferase
MITLYTGGTFDLFHDGHVNLLKRCKLFADNVVVALNSDDFIFNYKGSYPVMSYEQRKTILESCIYVDSVIPNINGANSKTSILEVNPDIIAIGSDWTYKDYYKQMGFDQQWLDSQNIILMYIPYTNTISSTKIKNKINT